QSVPSLPYMNMTRSHTAVMYNGYMIIAFGVYGSYSFTSEVKVMDVTNLSSLTWVPTYKAGTSQTTTGSISTSTSTTEVVDNKKKFILILGSAIGGGLVIIAFIIFFMRRRRNTQNIRHSEYSAHSNNEPVSANISTVNSTGFPTQIQNSSPP
ncbi:13349_t:CDS:2, partial [Ambispora gerdemannii]